jgi:hypothetical protein
VVEPLEKEPKTKFSDHANRPGQLTPAVIRTAGLPTNPEPVLILFDSDPSPSNRPGTSPTCARWSQRLIA